MATEKNESHRIRQHGIWLPNMGLTQLLHLAAFRTYSLLQAMPPWGWGQKSPLPESVETLATDDALSSGPGVPVELAPVKSSPHKSSFENGTAAMSASSDMPRHCWEPGWSAGGASLDSTSSRGVARDS